MSWWVGVQPKNIFCVNIQKTQIIITRIYIFCLITIQIHLPLNLTIS